MKLITAVTAAFVSATAASPDAAIYSYAASSHPTPSTSPKLSLSNARLILADRLELSQFHSLEDASEDTLSVLSSSSQQPLFSSEDSKSKVFLFIEGAKQVKDVLPEEKGRRQQLASLLEIPGTLENADFVTDLVSLTTSLSQGSTFVDPTKLADDPAKLSIRGGCWAQPKTNSCIYSPKKDGAESAANTVARFSEHVERAAAQLQAYHVSLPSDKSQYKGAAQGISDMIKSLVKSSGTPEQDLVVVVVPASAKVSKQASWGQAAGSLMKRAKEEPLVVGAAKSSSTRPAVPTASGNSSQVKTTMERCSKNELECISRTNSCSGHGKCSRKYKNNNGECWTCECSPTKGKSGTQHWGGPACQKKDISMEFWLFTGFAIFGTAAVTWGIGLLFTMGNEELPSVLGAGVAPTVRK